MAGKGEPWALRKMKAENDKYANLARAEDLTLRQASVTSWHAAAPTTTPLAETAAAVVCARRRRGHPAGQRAGTVFPLLNPCAPVLLLRSFL